MSCMKTPGPRKHGRCRGGACCAHPRARTTRRTMGAVCLTMATDARSGKANAFPHTLCVSREAPQFAQQKWTQGDITEVKTWSSTWLPLRKRLKHRTSTTAHATRLRPGTSRQGSGDGCNRGPVGPSATSRPPHMARLAAVRPRVLPRVGLRRLREVLARRGVAPDPGVQRAEGVERAVDQRLDLRQARNRARARTRTQSSKEIACGDARLNGPSRAHATTGLEPARCPLTPSSHLPWPRLTAPPANRS